MKSNEIEINFASSNADKIAEVRQILKQYGIKLNPMNVKVREIQSNSLEEIAADSAKVTAESLGKSIMAEDAGLFIAHLKGFPGPYSSYVYLTIGCNGIIQLMKGDSERTAVFRSAVSYCEPGYDPLVFTGEITGKISLIERRGRKFGYDPIFIPDGLDGRAFSELNIAEKNRVSHRSRSLEKLASWLLSRRKAT